MKKKTLFYPVAIIVGVIFAFVLGEIAIRTYWYFRPLSRNGRIIIDEKLGWKACWNSSYYGKEVDAAGAEYLVDYKTNEHGFRFYGDIEQPQDGKKKKFFL